MGAFLRRVFAPSIVALALTVLLVHFPAARGQTPLGDAGPTCASGTICVDVDGTAAYGPAILRAQGILSSVSNQTDPDVVMALRPQNWRISISAPIDHVPTGFDDMYVLAKRYGARVTWVVSDSWIRGTNNAAPELDWNRYTTFVAGLVRNSISANEPIDQWDVLNEPYDTSSRSTYLDQYRYGYFAIKGVDGNAHVVGPSIAAFEDVPINDTTGPGMDLTTFLNGEIDNPLLPPPLGPPKGVMNYFAVTWHEIGFDPGGTETIATPTTLIAHANTARALITARPAVNQTVIQVNEFGPPAISLLPGWVVAMIANFEIANYDYAGRSCWPDTDQIPGQTVDECTVGVLNGLLLADQKTTRAAYWVQKFYADMTGDRVSTVSSDGHTTAFATRDDSTQTLRVMVGRHQTCTKATNPHASQCPDDPSLTPPPSVLTIAVKVPYALASVTAEIDQIANVPLAFPAPIIVSSSVVPVQGGEVTVSVPAFADGEAYTVSLSPVVPCIGCDAGVVVVAPDAAPIFDARPDAVIVDAPVPDVLVIDAPIPDALVVDAAITDVAIPDAAIPDVAIPDVAIPDVAIPDVAILDRASPADAREVLDVAVRSSDSAVLDAAVRSDARLADSGLPLDAKGVDGSLDSAFAGDGCTCRIQGARDRRTPWSGALVLAGLAAIIGRRSRRRR